MAGFVRETRNPGEFHSGSSEENPLVDAFASSVSSPVVTPKMLRAARKEKQDLAHGGGMDPHVPGTDLHGDPTKNMGSLSYSVPSNFHSGDTSKMAAASGEAAYSAHAESRLNALVTPQTRKDYSYVAVQELISDLDAIKNVDMGLFAPSVDAHPLALLLAMCKQYGVAWFDWEPETLWSELDSDGAKEISRAVKDKILAVRGVHKIDDFFTDCNVFEAAVNAFNHSVVDFATFQPPEIPEIHNAVMILSQIRDDGEYSLEVRAYIQAIAKYTGYLVLPQALHFVSKPEDILWDDVIARTAAFGFEAKDGKDTFSPTSIIDGQAKKHQLCGDYLHFEQKAFSDQINQFFYF